MSDDTNLEINVEAKGVGQAALNSVADSLSAIQERMAGVIKESKAVNSAAAAAEKSIAGIGKGARASSESLAQSTKSTGAFAKAQETVGTSLKAQSRYLAQYREQQEQYNTETSNQVRITRELASAQELAAQKAKRLSANSASSLNTDNTNPYTPKVGAPIAVKSATSGGGTADYNASAKAAQAEAIATDAAAKATANYNTVSKSTRGLSLDKAIGFQVAGFAAVSFGKDILDVGAAAFSVAASYQKSFSNVQRTTQTSGKEAQKLKDNLIELSTEVPHTFEDITAVAALGGQLGIASSGIVDFTRVVTKLKLTTDLTYEAAGTAIGRISTLLKVPSSQFENLASSILKVGINSVATESQIVKTANNLASIGNLAGLSAPQVIGLSGALASLGIPPELARGTFEQLFTKIATASENGGAQLDTFAKISGKTSKEFADDWNSGQASKVQGDLTAFFKGLGKEGSNARNALGDLGIVSVRYVPTLLKLAQNTGVYTKALKDATAGYVNNTELASQYAVRTNTVDARLQELNNTFHAFLNNIGSNTLAPIAGALDLIQKMATALKDFSATPFGGAFLTGAAAISAFAGIALVAVGTVAKFVGALGFLSSTFGGSAAAAGVASAAFLGYDSVLLETVAADAALEAGLVATARGFNAEAVAAVESAAAMKVYNANATQSIGGKFAQSLEGVKAKAAGAADSVLAFASSPLVLVSAVAVGLTALSLFSARMIQVKDDAAAAAAGVGQLNKANAGSKQLSGNQIVKSVRADKSAISSAKSTTNVAVSADQGTKAYARQQDEVAKQAKADLGGVDKQLASLVKNGNLKEAESAFNRLGGAINGNAANYPKYIAAVTAYDKALAVANGTMTQSEATQGLTKESAAALAKQYDQLSKSLDATAKATASYTAVAAGTLTAQVSFQQAIADTTAAQQKAGKATLDASGNLDITTQKGRDATTALLGLASAGNQVTANLEQQAQPLAKVQASYDDTVKRVRTLGTSYGLTGKALDAFVNAAVAPIDPDYSSTVDSLQGVGNAAFGATGAIKGIPDSKTTKLFADKRDLEKKIAAANQQIQDLPSQKSTTLRAETAEAKRQLDAISFAILGIPSNKTTNIAVSGTASAIQQIQALNAALRSAGSSVHVATGPGGAGGITRAKGGLVLGPGSGTSDSVQARLSNGEFVLTAKATKQLGVPYLNSLNSNGGASQRNNPLTASAANRASISSGNASTGYITIAPAQFAQLVQAVTTQPPVQIGNQTVANASNAANLTVAKRGANG